MRRFLVLILVLVFSCRAESQLPELSCLYLDNTMAINPAFAGNQDALSATVTYRNQWVGFPDAPVNLIMSLHTPFYGGRAGAGVLLKRNTIGIQSSTGIYGIYSYRLELHRGTLAMGLGFGIEVYNMQWNKLIAADQGDELLKGNENSAILPDFSLGVYYSTKRCFAGISLPGFISHELNSRTGKYQVSNSMSGYTLMISGGYYFNPGEQIQFLPSVLMKINSVHNPQIDLNAQAIFKDKIWLGAGYRTNDVLIGLLQCQVNYQTRIGYAYDFELGRTGRFSSGSHEAALSYVFSYVRKASGPRNF
ncbi:MAG TPA: PorP/SprF family type IX secretion system membrane protein [Bacteroidales bacterium]|nr:PorP/SprF family type IX secretion system membrane protein [Bacteroidales bacterium]